MDMVARYADRVIAFSSGRIIADDAPARALGHADVRRYVTGSAAERSPRMLKIDGLHVAIGSVVALRGLSLEVADGAMVGLVGRNGAGKTTLMRSVMGHLAPTHGASRSTASDLAALPRHARAALGIGYMPEDRGLVPELTVEENILVPVWVKSAGARRTAGAGLSRAARADEMRDRRALLLSGGQQKLVALARALAVGTRLLLLDEPFEGVAPALSQRLAEVIGALRAAHSRC